METAYGYCHCGCGQKTRIASRTHGRFGHRKGEPIFYVFGHKPPSDLKTRFDANYIPVTECGCWLWVGNYQTMGYGIISVKNKRHLAHRVSWELHHGPIPQGLVVCHKCDTPACVNPNHLFLGTQQANITDMCAKGRNYRGENHYKATLKIDDVLQIRERYATDNITLAELGDIYGVAFQTVSCIVNRKRWKHI